MSRPGGPWRASPGQRQCRWPQHRRKAPVEDTDMETHIARLEAILPPQLAIMESSMHGYGIFARKSFAPGSSIAVEHALIWAAFGKRGWKHKLSFNALEMFPQDLPDVEAKQSAITLMLAMLQRHSQLEELLQSWLRVCPKGPQAWRSLPATKLALERRLRHAQEIISLATSDFSISEAEFIDLDLKRIGAGVGPATIVPLCFALLNHSCCPNAKLTYRSSQGSLICTRAIEPGEEIFISYFDEVDDVLSRRHRLLELHGVKCLCPRCASNFATSDCRLINSWVCPGCKNPVDDEVVQCACGTVVTSRDRQERRRREQQVWAALTQATSYVAKLASTRSKVDRAQVKSALRCVSQAQWEFAALRPPGSQARVKAWAQLRSFFGLPHLCLDAVAKFLRRIEMDFVRELAGQHSAISAEVTVLQPDLSVGAAAWARRLVAALRLYELSSEELQLVQVGPRSHGYVMLDTGQRLKHLLSYGVGSNIDFEWELAIAGTRVHLFDHRLDSLPRQHPNFSFHQEALCAEELPGGGSTLTAAVQLVGGGDAGPLALKCDVAGAEFCAILATDSAVLGRFDQIWVQLHWLGRPRCGDAQVKAMALEKLNEQFVMMHAHGNSYGDVVDVAGCDIPDVLEVLYVHRRLLSDSFKPSSTGLVPGQLDVNRCPFVPDICLRGAPFGADLLEE
ncbi:unnamed protein product [Effrenium voratum]|nr:unnamed protein product [Effrenium voratum]